MRAIAFVTSLIDHGKLSEDEAKRMLIHSIRADEEMAHHGIPSKLNAEWSFLTHLRDKGRAAVLMLDGAIITETPPLSHRYGRVGRQVEVPITGRRSQRVVHGALNVRSGGVVLLITHTAGNSTRSPRNRG